MFHRAKRLWKLSQKNPEALEKLLDIPDTVLKNVPEAGDGKAEFIPMGSEEEFKEYERESRGLKGVFGL
jgi:hypothetical protein